MSRLRVARLVVVIALALGGLAAPAATVAAAQTRHSARPLASESRPKSLDRALRNHERHSRRRILAHMALGKG